MEEAAELGNYLPLSFKTRSDQDYIAFLWNAFETDRTLMTSSFNKTLF
jgi:hypothetical protein